MTILTEAQHAAEFIAFEVNRDLSRKAATLKSGQNLTDGRCVKYDVTGKLVATTGSQASDGSSDEDIAGFLIGDVDATTADKPCVIVSRLAVCKESAVTLHGVVGGGAAAATAAVTEALEARNIVLL